MPEATHNDLRKWLASRQDDPAFLASREDTSELLDFLERLRDLRRGAGLSQDEVAKAMGTSQPAVSTLESGETDPQIRTLMKYARAVGARLQLRLDIDQLDDVPRQQSEDAQEEAAVADLYVSLHDLDERLAAFAGARLHGVWHARPRQDTSLVASGLVKNWIPIVIASSAFSSCYEDESDVDVRSTTTARASMW